MRWEGIKENGYLRSWERSYFNEEGRAIRFECQREATIGFGKMEIMGNLENSFGGTM